MIKFSIFLIILLFTVMNVLLIKRQQKKLEKIKDNGKKILKNEFFIAYTVLIVEVVLYIISLSFIDNVLFYVMLGFNLLFNITILSVISDIKEVIRD